MTKYNLTLVTMTEDREEFDNIAGVETMDGWLIFTGTGVESRQTLAFNKDMIAGFILEEVKE